MKIVVFAPHPDDEIFGCGGSILKWMDEGHDLHVVYVTDNRALITWGIKENQLLYEYAGDYINLNEDEVAEIALKEASQVSNNFGFKKENVYFFNIHDQDVMNNFDLGIKLSMNIIKDADRILLPSDNNPHPDHQGTHSMVKKAAKNLNLLNSEFYVYVVHTSLKLPKEKQIRVKVDKYRNKVHELMEGYKTQLCLKESRIGWEYMLKRRRVERFGIFKLKDMNKFQNF
jgi:LmbE family N-acetylglucosaminyl deacetylase